MSKPYVTVLIDTYNHERFIEQAVVSVLEQDIPANEMEILVVDDGSTDRTTEIVRKFEPRLRLIRKANGGQASAFNLGIPQAQGEIIAFLDGDDWWAPSKLREVVEAFEKNPGIGTVGHGYYEVYLDAERNRLVVPKKLYRLALSDKADALAFRQSHNFVATSRLTVRKEVLDRILPVPEELIFMADAFIFCLAIAAAGAIILETPLCYYRIHAQNLWTTGDPGRLRRRQELEECLEERLLQGSPSLDIPRPVLLALAEHWRLRNERFHLSRDGGNPWRTFQTEREHYRLNYSSTSLGYKVHQILVLGLTLVMPPRRFYQLQRWYSKKGFRRYREKLGNAVPASQARVLIHSVGNIAAISSPAFNRDKNKT